MRRISAVLLLASCICWRLQAADIADPPSVYAVYSGEATAGQVPACWVCKIAEVGTPSCPGVQLVPETDWDASGLAGLSGCAAVRKNQCSELKNFDCGVALQPGRKK